LVDVVTGSKDPKGRGDAEDIAEQVNNIINPDTFIDLDLSAYGYQLGNTRLENDTDISSKNNNGYVFRKLLRYSHLIIKN
jgi:putative aminopeptidase FrvX